MSKLPLADVVVLDLTQIYNGPYCTFLLAAAGAEVIKIEPPDGEHLRKRQATATAALPFAMLNQYKKSLRLDLKTERGRGLLRDLAKGADVLVENFAPGVMDRLGLGRAAMAEINPRLIYAASSGYGSTGPYRDYPAMDLTVQAMSGIMSITGFPDGDPVRAGATVCDFFGGVHLYGAIVTALLARERTGTAPAVEVAMLEASYFSLASNLAALHSRGASPRVGNRQGSLSLAPYNVYPCADGHIAIITNHDAHWRALLTAFGQHALLDDPRFTTIKSRVQHMDLVDSMVTGWTRPLTKQAAFEILIKHRVPCAPVRELHEVIADPHLHARGWLQEIDHPEFGRITVPSSPLHLEGLEPPPARPSAPLGADSAAVLRERLGLGDAEIAQLQRDKVI
ncbi:MAG: CoA transferase [Alphaproteobacteria bacterium]|nr:CoA transferase [Alphaproteobacteria bacterium]